MPYPGVFAGQAAISKEVAVLAEAFCFQRSMVFIIELIEFALYHCLVRLFVVNACMNIDACVTKWLKLPRDDILNDLFRMHTPDLP